MRTCGKATLKPKAVIGPIIKARVLSNRLLNATAPAEAGLRPTTWAFEYSKPKEKTAPTKPMYAIAKPNAP